MKKWNDRKQRRLLLLLCTVVMLSASCGREDPVAEETMKETEAFPVLAPAEPFVGVGRETEPETEPPPPEPKGYCICIDPGHGFVDGGTGEGVFEDGTLEKDINMLVANLLNEDLIQLGYDTVVTHDGEHLPAADTNQNHIFNANERVAYANTLDIDYFISIHVNAVDNEMAHGIQIYYEQNWRKVNEWSQPIAESMADHLAITFPDAPEPKLWGNEPDKTLAVTRETTAAACLIEIGFCTNETDRKNMLDAAWREELAQGIAAGIDGFFTGLEKN